MATTDLSRLMKISWAVQKDRNSSRSKSLVTAWAIVQNEDIVIQNTAVRLNHRRPVSERTLSRMAIFQ